MSFKTKAAARAYMRRWKEAHPGYNTNWSRRKRGEPAKLPKAIMILGVKIRLEDFRGLLEKTVDFPK